MVNKKENPKLFWTAVIIWTVVFALFGGIGLNAVLSTTFDTGAEGVSYALSASIIFILLLLILGTRKKMYFPVEFINPF